MASLEELRDSRLKKMKILHDAGMEAFPSSVPKTHSLSKIRESFDELVKNETAVSVAGRVMSVRGQGAI